MYDENNLLLGFIYNEETYYYQRTLAGEIVKIINSEGLIVGEYIYDAYGNILNINSLTDIAEINPYRYKGYYFDTETHIYYCRSRYYSPEIIRWISQDEIEYLDISNVNGCNLYTYCLNHPSMNYYNVSEGLNIYKYDKNNVTIKFNLQFESTIDNMSVDLRKLMFVLIILICKIDYDKSTINGVQFLQLKDRGNPNGYVEPYPYSKKIDEMEFPFNKYKGTFAESLGDAFLYSGDPGTFADIGNEFAKIFTGGNGGGINNNRALNLIDILLEISEW